VVRVDAEQLVVYVVSFKVLTSARIVYNIVCTGAKLNLQGNDQKLISSLTNFILT
jgi:hypothetical protein